MASLSGRPLTASGFRDKPSSSYGNIADALGAVKAQQQMKAPAMRLAEPCRPQRIGLPRAQARSDASNFFKMLNQSGIRT